MPIFNLSLAAKAATAATSLSIRPLLRRQHPTATATFTRLYSSPRATPDPTKGVVVRNIPFTATAEDVGRQFEKYGDLERAVHPRGELDNVPEDHAFVYYRTKEDVEKVIARADGTEFMGQIIGVERIPSSGE